MKGEKHIVGKTISKVIKYHDYLVAILLDGTEIEISDIKVKRQTKAKTKTS